MQDCSQALKICKCLWSLSCGSVSNKLLVISIAFHCHYYVWGCIYSIGPFQFRRLKGDIHSTRYRHHQIGSINLSHCYYIFRGCAPVMFVTSYSVTYCVYISEKPGFIYIIIVQFLMSSNSQMRFGVQIIFVCLYITPSHYHHYTDLSDDIELIKCLSDIFCRVCE